MSRLKGLFFFLLIYLIQGIPAVQAQEMVTVYPKEYPDALRNPLKGFRPDPDEVGNTEYPYTTIVRDYIRWNEIENDADDGVQKIIDFCNKEWKGFEKANVKVIPRIYLQWHEDPKDRHWPADLTNGDWSSQEFKDRVVKLIYKLGEAWDNDPRVAWVQTGIIGYWGEQENPVGVDDDGWGERLGNAFTTAFKNKKLVVRNQKDWPGYELGVYWDSYAHPGQRNGAWADIKNHNTKGVYLNQVVEGEVAYGWGEDVFDPVYGGEPETTLNNDTYTNNMIDVIKELHCTGLGWIASYMEIDNPSSVNRETIKKNASRIQKEFGYRFVIPEFSCSSRANQNQQLKLNFKVKNVGSAPFYENWPVAFVLIDEATGAIVWKEILPNVDIRDWHPGDNYNFYSRTYATPAQEYSIEAMLNVPSNIISGQYMAGISILEPTTQSPGVFFALENFLATNQTQPICRIGIGQDLMGEYSVTATADDPLLNDARYYSISTDNIGLSINYPNNGSSIKPQAVVPVYVSAFNTSGSIDRVELYVNGKYEATVKTSPYNFSLSKLLPNEYTIEVRAYDDKGVMKTDSKVFTVQYPGGIPWVETFTLPIGSTSDEGSTAWTSSRGGGVFEVRNGAFQVSSGYGFVGVFKTEVIKTYGAPVTVSLDVNAMDAGLDAGDYVELYKKVDGVETLIDRVSGYNSKTIIERNIVGNELQLIVKSYVSYVSEVFQFDNLSVTYDVQPATNELSLGVIGNGKIDPSPGKYPIYKGADISISATPYVGFKFGYWSGDYSGTANPFTIKMDTDKSITANFIEMKKFALVLSAENGTVSINPAADTYYEGTVVTLTASANTGYQFVGWSGDLSGNSNQETILMTENRNVTALFVKIPEYTLITNIENGSIKLDPPGGTYKEGTEVRLTVTPNANYKFANWGGDLSGADNPAKIIMNSDKNVTAVIQEIPSYTLVITSPNGKVSYAPVQEAYREGSSVFMAAIPDEGYKFTRWEGDLTGNLNPTNLIFDSNKNVIAIFDKITSIDEFESNANKSLLLQNYPNPFADITTIPYHLRSASHVKLFVFNFLGEKVVKLVDEYQQAGDYFVEWNAQKYLVNGVYLIRMEIDNGTVQAKKAIIKR